MSDGVLPVSVMGCVAGKGAALSVRGCPLGMPSLEVEDNK